MAAEPTDPTGLTEGAPAPTMILTSSAFLAEGLIPQRYTCDGANLSPALRWDLAPAATVSFALVVADPDTPTKKIFYHWVIYNIPARVRMLEENRPGLDMLVDASRQGHNSAHKPGYTGPCPPPPGKHRYYFTLYALSKMLTLAPGAGIDLVAKQMEGHILATGQLMGRYERLAQ